MSIRRALVLLVVTVATLMALLTMAECRAVPPRNSVAYLAWNQNVSEDKVRAVIGAFGLEPQSLKSFGPEDFPINYVARRLEAVKRENGQLTRADVETIMRGYDAKCDVHGARAVYYLYYSTNLDANGSMIHSGIAMVIEVGYGANDSTEVTGWLSWNPRDSGFEPWREDIRTACGI